LPLFLWALTALAAPEPDREPDWWRGVMVADVELLTDGGSLPEEDLEPLLQVKDGEPLDPADIQADLQTLYRVGNFRSVEARVEPAPLRLANGQTVEVAKLTYAVFDAPEIARITIQGNKRFSKREIRDVLGLVDGQEFYVELDGPPAEARVQSWLAKQGYPEASVQVRASSPAPEPERQFVNVSIEEGPPDIVRSIGFKGEFEDHVSEEELRRWAKRSGLEVGKPLVSASLKATRERIKERLGTVTRSIGRKVRGLVEARVTTLAAGEVGDKQVTITIEPNDRLVLDIDGMSRKSVVRALSIDPRVRLTGSFRDGAEETLRRYLQERGWYAAEVEVDLRSLPGRKTLVVDAELGAKHTIGPRLLVLPHRLGSSHAGLEFDFEIVDGEDASPRLERDLQALFFLASPDVLNRHYYTAEAMEAGRERARAFLVKQGHLDAEVTVEEPTIRPRRGPAVWFTAPPRQQKIRPSVRVELGPVTRLVELRIEGLAAPVEARAREFLVEALGRRVPKTVPPDLIERWASAILGRGVDERLVGQPYSPQDIETLRDLIVTAHLAEGHLEAEAVVTSTAVAEQQRQAVITVDPGPQVRLRSVVAQGRRRTKRRVIVNTVDLRAGTPLRAAPSPTPQGDDEAPRDLEDVRNDLYGLGAFEAVVLRPVGDGVNRDLLVQVSEQSRWRFEPGLGFSTDQGLRLLFNGTRENLWGLTHRLRAQLLGSVDLQGPQLDTLRSTFNPPELRASVEYTAPRFPLASQDFVADVVIRDWRQERTWRLTRTGGGVRVLTNLDRRTQVGAGVRVENRRLSQVAPAIVLEGEPWQPQEDGTWQQRWQAALTAQFVWDQRNDPLNPSRGVLLSVNGELAPGFGYGVCVDRATLLSCARREDQLRTSFVKGEARFSGFRRVSRRGWLLKTTARVGYVRMLSDPQIAGNASVPGLEDRFRLGGTGSLRGFRRHGVGPHNRVEDLVVQSATSLGPALGENLDERRNLWVPTGGDTLAVFGAEIVAPLPALGLPAWEGYSLAGFVEVGNTWLLNLPPGAVPVSSDSIEGDDDWRAVNPFLRWSVGIGGRRDTPIGPIQIDLAVNPQRLGFLVPSGTASFLQNQLDEGWFRLHVTLGELF